MKTITHVSLSIIVVVILVLASSLVALAGTFRSPSKDIYCLVNGTCANGYGIRRMPPILQDLVTALRSGILAGT